MSLLICTIGTSALLNFPRPGDARERLQQEWAADWRTRGEWLGVDGFEARTSKFREAAVRDLASHLKALHAAYAQKDNGQRQALLRVPPAELTSYFHLRRHRNMPVGDILLMTSDTGPGEAAADIVADLFAAVHGDERVSLDRIQALDASDHEVWTQKGLDTLRARVHEVARERMLSGEEVILNITGGLKGGVPMMTAVALNLGLKLIYQFEGTDSLVQIDGVALALQAGLAPTEARPPSPGDAPVATIHYAMMG